VSVVGLSCFRVAAVTMRTTPTMTPATNTKPIPIATATMMRSTTSLPHLADGAETVGSLSVGPLRSSADRCYQADGLLAGHIIQPAGLS
jgi:hypothetical protein